MTKVELKTSIKDLVNKLDDAKLLKAYHALLITLTDENDTLGYSAQGEPLMAKSIVKKVKAASARVKAGEYLSQEDLEKHSQKW